MTKTTTQADAPVRKCTNDVLSVPRERFLDIASKLDSLAFDDDPYEYHDNEGVESISDIADNLLNPTYRKAIMLISQREPRTFLTTLLKSSVPTSRKIKSILKRIACI